LLQKAREALKTLYPGLFPDKYLLQIVGDNETDLTCAKFGAQMETFLDSNPAAWVMVAYGAAPTKELARRSIVFIENSAIKPVLFDSNGNRVEITRKFFVGFETR
jgi:hypothetical protein